jgi:hydrogenase maturation protein HypF
VDRARVRVSGTVQGVGFRPFVHRHAVELGLTGFVLNDSGGVLIDVEGEPARISELVRRVAEDPPPLARVAGVSTERLEPTGRTGGFRIVESEGGGAPAVPVSIDSATCDNCLAEIFDPADRRYRYPFTNCTNCGPRYTIVLGVPYDRPATTMAPFRMCAACQEEYDDPGDRRFHAQPNACPSCGPELTWAVPGEATSHGEQALDAAIDALRRGAVVAMKGIGGYHLAVDATDGDAVAALRRRKARDAKPFAVMVTDREQAESLCVFDTAALQALESPRRPIVLVPRRVGAAVAHGVAPGSPELGVMLPYSPLHHLVLAGVGRPLVMTSGNASDEPIAHEDDDAATRLAPLFDGMLSHDRAIHIRCDDSVVRAAGGRVRSLRRSRGFAPEPLRMPFVARRSVLAVGAELKSTISVAQRDWVVPSHHIGDLEHLATYRSFVQAISHLSALYGVTPDVVAHDLHPDYLSSKFAADLDLPAIAVQHHHAHVASCMVEHGRTAPVLGIAFDGLGYGTDGTLWGGEFMIADLVSFRRVGHLRPAPMPGGVNAIRQPWRMGAIWAAASAADRATIARLFPGVAGPTVDAVLDLAGGTSTPMTTSVGRLFDAVAALLGCRTHVSYEAQAAIELEAMARTIHRSAAPSYSGTVPRTTVEGVLQLDPAPLIAALLADLANGVAAPIAAAGFHEALGRAATGAAVDLAAEHALDTVVLTGGVFQNERLSAIMEQSLERAGLRVLRHAAIPANDGGISVGQAAIAAFA